MVSAICKELHIWLHQSDLGQFNSQVIISCVATAQPFDGIDDTKYIISRSIKITSWRTTIIIPETKASSTTTITWDNDFLFPFFFSGERVGRLDRDCSHRAFAGLKLAILG